MLDATFGCIAYLRGLLPDDDFIEERYNAPDEVVPAGKDKNKSKDKDKDKAKDKHRRSGQRIMRLRRNSSKEADQLLEYLVSQL